MPERTTSPNPGVTAYPEPTLLFEPKPEFADIVARLDQEAAQMRGHALFWRLYIDVLNTNEAQWGVWSKDDEKRNQSIKLNAKEDIEELTSKIESAREDPRFELDTSSGTWTDSNIRNSFRYLRDIHADPSAFYGENQEGLFDESGSIYNIVYRVTNPNRFETVLPNSPAI